MRRSITLAGFALLALVCCRPAAAQRFSAGRMADQLATQGKEQVSRAKKYALAPNSKAYMSSPRSSLNYGAVDDSGRIDMSGRVPPSYYKFRESSAAASFRGYAPAARGQAPRSNYHPNHSDSRSATATATATAPAPRTGHRSSAGAIPPPPL